MRVLLVTYEYPPETGFGGIGSYCWHHARGLAKLGHDVHVLAGSTEVHPLLSRTEDGVTVHRLRATGPLIGLFGAVGRRGLWWTANRLENGWTMYRGLSELVARFAPDIVEMPECGAEGWAINHLMSERTVVRFHSPARLIMDSYDVAPLDITLCSAIERLGIAGAGAMSACSRFLADEVQTTLGVRRPIEVIPNGIDLEWFDRQPATDVRRRFAIPADRPLVLFTGRMEKRKGIHLCPEIVGSIVERHDAAFVFAGRDLFGYMANTLLPAVQRRHAKGTMHYVGAVDLATVRSLLREADIFLLPSLWENCPYSVIEAMAAGTAVVASNQGGLPELVRPGHTGLLATTGDAASFVDAIERLLAEPALRRRLGEEARRFVEASLVNTAIAERSTDVYRRAFGLPSPAAGASAGGATP